MIETEPAGPVHDPYRHIWAAVLYQAAEDAWSRFHNERQPARYWLQSEEDGPGSFLNVCAILGLIPDRARQAILSCRNPESRSKLSPRTI
jgi:hypothetical protein